MQTELLRTFPRGIGVLRRVGHLLYINYDVQLHFTTVFQLLQYSVGSCGKGMCNRLQTLQNRSARVVTSSSNDRRSIEVLDELGWDNLHGTRRTRKLATIMYKLKITFHQIIWLKFSIGQKLCSHLRNSKHNLFVLRPYNEAGKTAYNMEGRFSGIVYHANTVKGQTSLKSFMSHL